MSSVDDSGGDAGGVSGGGGGGGGKLRAERVADEASADAREAATADVDEQQSEADAEEEEEVRQCTASALLFAAHLRLLRLAGALAPLLVFLLFWRCVGLGGRRAQPQLKYSRLGNSVASIVQRDAFSAIAVHLRFVALGTHAGAVYVLDFNGNEIRRFAKHTATVNALAVARGGEWLASAGDDGRVVVASLYSDECVVATYSRPVLAVALDPDFASKAARPFAAGGREGKLLLNSKGFFRAKDQVLHSGEGSVYTIAWRTDLIAWANDVGVKIYDCTASARISYIARPRRAPRADLYRATLRWLAPDALLVGW